MKAKVFCERCKKYETIEIETSPSVKSNSERSITPIIPKPGASGLKTYSIVHNDHILIADIDRNGDVRSYKIIERIGVDIERLISAISSKIMNFTSSRKNDYRSLVIVSENRLLRNIIISVSNQLLLNIDSESMGILQVTRSNTLLEYNNFNIYFGEWKDKILNIQSDKDLFAYHLHKGSASTLMDKIRQGLENDHSDYYAILFDTIFIKTETWKKVLNQIIQPNPHIILSDVGDPLKATMSLSILIDKLLD